MAQCFILFIFFADLYSLTCSLSDTSNIVTLSKPLSSGDIIDSFVLEGRIDSLGIEKSFARDHSYFGISPLTSSSPSSSSLTSLSSSSSSSSSSKSSLSFILPKNNNQISSLQNNKQQQTTEEGEEGEEYQQQHSDGDDKEITPLDEVHVDSEDDSIKNGNFYLNRKIFFGGHGEIWLAKKVLENGNVDLNTSYVLKRMHLKDRPTILRCALREIYFGNRLASNPRIARFVAHFQIHDDYWLVFHDEGVSLQSVLYALTIDRGLPAFEPSAIWRRMRTTGRGESSMKSILYQILLGIASLHRVGIVHRDIKPSNILINDHSPLTPLSSSASIIRLLIADFSSAIDDEVVELGLYGSKGPTIDEESEQYMPPETLFSCIDEEENEDCNPTPYDPHNPESYDSWSIGVLFAEMILGTADIFSVDQRTSALISHKMRHASKKQIEEAMKLAAMAEMCIYNGSVANSVTNQDENEGFSMFLPSLEKALQVSRKYLKPTVQSSQCGLSELERAIQRRDPLGTGYHNREGLHLLSLLLKWNPNERISVRDALSHAYFVGAYVSSVDGSEHMTKQDRDRHDSDILLTETIDWNEEMIDNHLHSTSTSTSSSSTESIVNDDETFSHDTQLFRLLPFHPLDSILTTGRDNRNQNLNHNNNNNDNHNNDNEEEEDSISTPLMSSDLVNSLSFHCPHCNRTFSDWSSCHKHIITRKHGIQCLTDTHLLPSCLSSHSLLPIDPHSGWCDLQGRRQYIEDTHTIIITEDYRFFGVFDGHWGNRAANYASHHIHLLFDQMIQMRMMTRNKQLNSTTSLVATEQSLQTYQITEPIHATIEWKQQFLLSIEQLNESFNQSTNRHNPFHSLRIIDVIDCLHHSFIQTNNDFLFLLQSNKEESRSGTTASISIIFSEFILIGSVGDSRVVLCCEYGRPIQLTVDHTPEDEKERNRVLSAGGTIKTIDSSGIPRVNGLLAVTRTIGDAHLRGVLTSVPDILIFRRTPMSAVLGDSHSSFNYCSSSSIIPQFLIVASDGVWDVLSNDEVIQLVCQFFSQRSSNSDSNSDSSEEKYSVDLFQQAARMIGQEAFIRGSSDNIGVCVINLMRE